MKKLTIISSSVILLTMLATSVLSTGCQKQVDPAKDEPTQTQLSVTAEIDKVEAAQTLASGIRDTEFNISDAIGLYVVAYRKPGVQGKLEVSGNYVDNAKSTKGSVAWTNAPTIYYPSVNVDVFAYSPYNVTFSPTATPDQYKFTVAANQSTTNEVAKYDFMSAQVVNQTPTPSAIAMKFYHRLSKIDVKFTIPTSFKGRTISGLSSIKFRNFKSGAIVDLLTPYTYSLEGAVGAGLYPKPAVVDPNSALIDIIPNAVLAGAAGTASHYEAIVVPQSQLGGIGFVEIIVNYQGGGTEKFYYQSETPINFYASRSTTINLQFQDNNPILLGTVGIQGWGDGGNHNGTMPEKEVFNTFTLNLGTLQTTEIKTVELTITQGTGTPVETVYTLNATHTPSTSVAAIAFDGTRKAPEFYPFTIKSAVCKSATGTTVTTVDCKNKAVTAAGAVTLP